MSIFNEPIEIPEIRPMAMAAAIIDNQLIMKCACPTGNLIWEANKKYFRILAEHQGVDIKDYELSALQIREPYVQLVFEKVDK